MSASFDTEAVKEQLEDLRNSLDDLKTSLSPLKIEAQDVTLSTYIESLADPISQAKMLVTLAFTVDSLLFCHLKMTGVNTDTHTIQNELERTRQYVLKIKQATAHQKRTMTVNAEAAKRMVQHDISSNATLDRERAIKTRQENERTERELAAQANVGKHTRFSNSGISQPATERLVANDSHDVLMVNDDADTDEGIETSSATAGTSGATTESMFDESKPEKKNRERRERKAAKKDRQRKSKIKKTLKDAKAT